MTSKTGRLSLALIGVVLGAARAQGEPIFLARQYNRCTTCHYSPTGGGLLTPYGRSLTRQELSTTGRSHSQEASATGVEGKEEAFLWGALGHALGPVDVEIDVRPSHLAIDVGGTSTTSNLFMNGDLIAAYRSKGWTVYGELGREPQPVGSKIASYEHWVGYQNDDGLGFRAGRFLPAYGLRLADHTALTRQPLGFDVFDQVYGLELSRTSERHLLQLSLSPGRADSILHDDGRRAFTATGRFETDLSSRSVLVVSGLYRGASTLQARNGAGGVAFGIAPTAHLTTWTEADAQFQQGTSGAPAYALINETGFEVYRGLWLKVSPQLRTAFGDASAGVFRMVFEANLLPRTHWNVDVSYYRDRNRTNDLVTKIFLAQLHLYI